MKLINLFQFEPSLINLMTDNAAAPFLKKRKLNDETENLISSKAYESKIDDKIKLKSLKDKLIRFKLLGPLSTTILANALQTIEYGDEEIGSIK